MSVPLALVGITLHPQDNHIKWFFTTRSSLETKTGGPHFPGAGGSDLSGQGTERVTPRVFLNVSSACLLDSKLQGETVYTTFRFDMVSENT